MQPHQTNIGPLLIPYHWLASLEPTADMVDIICPKRKHQPRPSRLPVQCPTVCHAIIHQCTFMPCQMAPKTRTPERLFVILRFVSQPPLNFRHSQRHILAIRSHAPSKNTVKCLLILRYKPRVALQIFIESFKHFRI